MNSINSYARKLKKELQSSETAEQLLNPTIIGTACEATGHRWRSCFWTPTVTILTFLRHMMQE